MNGKLCDLVRFEIDRLFNGAVDVDWLQSDEAKASRAASAFVFHGPGTHGVASSVAVGTGHRLIDTATFAAGVAADLANPGSRPFTLAIASYGSGKSHLAVTLTELFSEKADYPYAIVAITALADGFDLGTQKKPSKLYNKLSEGFEILNFEKTTDAQLLAWLKRHFDAEGIAVDASVLNFLIFRVGHSMQMLKSEVTKLSAYAKANGRREITVSDVEEITSSTIECDAFAISNAIIEKNAEKAFLALADMKMQRVALQAKITLQIKYIMLYLVDKRNMICWAVILW